MGDLLEDSLGTRGPKPEHSLPPRAEEIYAENLIQHGCTPAGQGYTPHECFGAYATMRSLLKIPADAEVLDVGCGAAMATAIFYDCVYIGWDASMAAVVAGQHFTNGAWPHRASVRQRAMESISGHYQYILCNGTFNVCSPWHYVRKMVKLLYKHSSRGLALGFQTASTDDPDFTIHPISKWVHLAQGLTRYYALDHSWSEVNAVLTLRHSA